MMSNNKLAIVGIKSVVRDLIQCPDGYHVSVWSERDGDVVYVWSEGVLQNGCASLTRHESGQESLYDEIADWHAEGKSWTESVQKAVRDVWNGGRA